MSVLAHVVLGGALQNEPAATQALAYILNSDKDRDIARAFVEMLRDADIEFEPGRIEAELGHEEAQPDLTIQDRKGDTRVFVENKFWAGLTDAQPVSYLEKLPEDTPSALLFIVPEQRVPTIWTELKSRCNEAGLEWTDATGGNELTWARIGSKAMAIISWRQVLERLLDTARARGHDDLVRDILQLQGLTGRMDAEAFLPLRQNEATDQYVARRLINYIDLIDDIIDKLVQAKIADKKGLAWGFRRHSTGRFFHIYAHNKFESKLGVDLRQWRRIGITPLWWSFHKFTGVVAEHFKGIPELMADVVSGSNRLYVPIRLKTGVERDAVIADAVAQIMRIADEVLKTNPNG